MPAAISEPDFAAFQALIHDATGIHLSLAKREMLASRLARRLQALGLTSHRAYYDRVIGDASGTEREALINCVTTNKTGFFREAHHFDFVRDRVIPEVRKRVAAGAPRRLRIWSAACSTGEEPYTLAMVAHKELAREGYAIEIAASDIDTRVLAHARAGLYGDEQTDEIPATYRTRYLQRTPRGWQVSKELLGLVQLHRINLLRDPYPFAGAFDAIFVRNVIIYFDRAGQRTLFDRLRPCLADSGYLVLGHSESLLNITTAFVAAGTTIYQPARPHKPAPVAAPAPVVEQEAMPRIKVVVVDDSALMRSLLTQLLAHDPEIEVVAAVPDPFAAWEAIKRTRPDVVTLDIEMPRMDGLAFLGRLMRHYPLPVVMVSSLTQAQCETSMRALELGAVEVIAKPTANVLDGVTALASELIDKVRAAARARVRKRTTQPPPIATTAFGLGGGAVRTTHQIIAIGASTGGTEAIKDVLTTFPADAPGVVIVQHMPERFTAAFAERLDRLCQVRVKEAKHGDRVLPGHALIAPGGHHMSVVRSGATCSVVVDQAPPVNRHRPSVDVLFHSCARQLGKNAVGVILTGMGADGAVGLKAMRDAGAHTIAQDEASSVVFGMPREAIERGGASEVVALAAIGAALWQRT